MTAARYGSLPFDEQIEFFRQKVNLGTDAWTDIWEGMHSRAFVVAGARGEVLTDLRTAVQRAIEEGRTLADFRKDFDETVAKTGWAYNGGRNWRTRVIYETNLRQSYAAGREQQMADPELRARRPYGLYRHGGSAEPRPDHLSWDGTVLPLDDPWWETHTPQNGWGCKCKKFMVSDRDVARMGLEVAGQAPPIQYEEKVVGTRGPNPRAVRVPKGIDPGFAYNPGTAAFGRQISREAMDAWQAQGAAAWERLSDRLPTAYGRPARIPLDAAPGVLGKPLRDQVKVETELTRILGGAEKVFNTPGGIPVLVNAQTLARHIDPKRAEYLPLLADTITNPFEQWVAFDRHKSTGKVVMRSRLIKAYDLGKGRGLLVVANATRGMLEAWTFMPTSKWDYLEKQRGGMLLYGRK